MALHEGMDISNLLEVQVTEEQTPDELDKENPMNAVAIILRPSQVISAKEKIFHDVLFGDDPAKVRFRKIHCTACDVHIGSAPSESHNMHEHPLLKTLLCTSCRQFYGDGSFEQGDDATDMFCRWCANGGNLYCCSYCSNTFCSKCIRRNFEPEVRKKIEADEKWKCFVCDPEDLFTLRAVCLTLKQHVKTLARILESDRVMDPAEIQAKMMLDDTVCCPEKRPKPAKRKSYVEELSSDDDKKISKTNSTPKSTRKRKRNRQPVNDDNDLQYINYENDDISSLLQCEQTMTVEDDENESVTYQTTNHQLPDTFFHNKSVTVMHRPVIRGGKTQLIPVRTLHKIDSIPPGTTPKVITKINHIQKKMNVGRVTKTPPMVSLPSGPRSRIHPNILTDKSNLNTNRYIVPSIIDLESDNEDSTTVNQPDKSQDGVVIEIDNDNTTNQDIINPTPPPPTTTTIPTTTPTTYPRLTVKTFEREINNPIKSIDIIVKKLRNRLKIDIEKFEKSSDGNDIHDARSKLKLINKNIDKVVDELAAFNNRMIRQYKPWKNSRITGDVDTTTTRVLLKKNNSNLLKNLLPLDMECNADSESDTEIQAIDDDEDEEEDGNDTGNINRMIDYSRKLVPFTEKDVIDKGCNTGVQTQDKGVQVYETINTDYDMKIGYSLLMRADYDYTKRKQVFKPVVIHDEYFGKYEEQFIFYLQTYEDRIAQFDNDDDNEKENASPCDNTGKTLNELIDADINLLKSCQQDVQVIQVLSSPGSDDGEKNSSRSDSDKHEKRVSNSSSSSSSSESENENDKDEVEEIPPEENRGEESDEVEEIPPTEEEKEDNNEIEELTLEENQEEEEQRLEENEKSNKNIFEAEMEVDRDDDDDGVDENNKNKNQEDEENIIDKNQREGENEINIENINEIQHEEMNIDDNNKKVVEETNESNIIENENEEMDVDSCQNGKENENLYSDNNKNKNQNEVGENEKEDEDDAEAVLAILNNEMDEELRELTMIQPKILDIPDITSVSPVNHSSAIENGINIDDDDVESIKNDETFNAVRALIEDNSLHGDDGDGSLSPNKQWINNEDDDECTIID